MRAIAIGSLVIMVVGAAAVAADLGLPRAPNVQRHRLDARGRSLRSRVERLSYEGGALAAIDHCHVGRLSGLTYAMLGGVHVLSVAGVLSVSEVLAFSSCGARPSDRGPRESKLAPEAPSTAAEVATQGDPRVARILGKLENKPLPERYRFRADGKKDANPWNRVELRQKDCQTLSVSMADVPDKTPAQVKAEILDFMKDRTAGERQIFDTFMKLSTAFGFSDGAELDALEVVAEKLRRGSYFEHAKLYYFLLVIVHQQLGNPEKRDAALQALQGLSKAPN